ncbi:hypothetical protein F3J36_22555 [Pantoea sp. Cy-640]|nr:hypothetical protein [Pantoea sp. Cy-640]
MQIHARYACITLYKSAGQEKGFRKTKGGHKKTATRAAAVRGLMNLAECRTIKAHACFSSAGRITAYKPT